MNASGAPPQEKPDYWPAAPVVAGLLLAIIAVRVHELIPALAAVRPALLSAVGGIVILWQRSSKRAKRAAFQDRTMKLVLAYMAWILMSSITALWVGLALETVQTLIPSLFLVLALLLVPPTEHAVDVVVRFLVVAVGFFSFMLVVEGTQIVEGRLSISSSLDPNDAAALMALTLPFAISAGIRCRSMTWKVINWISVVLMLAGLGATSSRGGTLAVLAGTITLVLAAPGSKKLIAIITAVIVGIVAWEHAPQAFQQRMTAFFNGEQDYNSTSYYGREAIWQRARTYMWQNPVLGVGPGNFSVAEGLLLTETGDRGKWSTTHNSYLQAGSELGIPGALLFTALIFVSLRRAKRWWRMPTRGMIHRPELMASMVSFAVSAVFLSHAYFYALFGLVGLIALSDRMLLRRRAELRLSVSAPRPIHPDGEWRIAEAQRLEVARVFGQPARPVD